jgi:hypothetical protein
MLSISWLTNSALVYKPKCGEGGGGVQSCTVYIGAQINFGDLNPYFTYDCNQNPPHLFRENIYHDSGPLRNIVFCHLSIIAIRIRETGSGVFVTPGSGIRDGEKIKIPDHISGSLETIFGFMRIRIWNIFVLGSTINIPDPQHCI